MAGTKKSHVIARHVAPLVPVALALASNLAGPSQPAPTTPLPEAPVAAKCEDVADFHACHGSYPTGCSPSANYDAYLNFLKNQLLPPPTAATPPPILTQADIHNLDLVIPPQLGGHSNNHAHFKDLLAQNGEGKVFSLIGYLYYAKLSGAESSNCELASDDAEGTNVDYHIYIGFDPGLAGKLRAKQALSPEEKKSITQTSIIVEMTPHYRAAYEEGIWTLDALKAVLGSQVRVTGQLMADSEHNVTGQNCALGMTPACWRSSIWELHPVTGFQVCKDSSNACVSGALSWAELGHPGP